MSESKEADRDREHAARMKELKKQQDAETRAKKEKRGVLVVHTGDGKGKSTAAFGVALRAAGHGQKVGVIQFVKGKWKTGEQAWLRKVPEIEHVIVGNGFTWNTQDRQADIASARRGWEHAVEMIEAARVDPDACRVLILDELNIVLSYEYLPLDEVLEVLRSKPKELSIVVTGRNAPQRLIEAADTVTEMRLVKHAYQGGVRARLGVEF